MCETAASSPRGNFVMLDPHGGTHLFVEQWSNPLPDQDLKCLMHFTTVLEEYMWVKIDREEMKGVPGMLFGFLAANIFFAYHTALAQLVLRSRMNGLHHIQLVPPTEVVREERLPVLLSRLTTLAPEVPPLELEKLDDEIACSICLTPFKSNDPEVDPVVQIPCKHMYCKTCLEQWIASWDRESALRVCTMCNDGFGLTAPSGEPLTKKPGFEPNPNDRIPTEDLGRRLQVLVWDIASAPGSHGWNAERPWWMNLLRQVEEETSGASGDETEPVEE